jgi:hypothetical protein
MKFRLSNLGAMSAIPSDIACKSCGSKNQSNFTSEIGIHFPGLEGISKPVVWVFPKLVVCLECGTAEFVVPEAQRPQLKGDTAATGWSRIALD